LDISLKSKSSDKNIVNLSSSNELAIVKKQRKKLWWEIPLGVLIGLVIVFGGILAYKTFIATGKIITENTSGTAPAFLDNVGPRELKGEGDGRINILLLGAGGEDHSGTYLTDTIMVVSIDPENKDVAMLSIPRDFYIYIPDSGYNRINAAYYIGERAKKNGGLAFAKDLISDFLDINIHYGLLVDFEGFKDIVDALGGITVDVKKALNDSSYPTERGGYQTVSFKKGIQKMNGSDALKFARSRYSTSDFDRAERQQQIMVAIKEKVLRMDTLLNPAKTSSLIDALGNHLKTDIQLWEIQRMIDLSREIDSTKIINKVLSPEEGLVKTTMIRGMSVVVPVANDYSEIRKFAHEIFVDNYLKKENAKIAILNSTSKAGNAQKMADYLKSYNYNIVKFDNFEDKTIKKTVIYDQSRGKKPYTLELLKKRLSKLGIKVEVKTNQNYSEDFVIILGQDYR